MYLFFKKTLSIQENSSPSQGWLWEANRGDWICRAGGNGRERVIRQQLKGSLSAQTRPLWMANTLLPQPLGTRTAEDSQMSPSLDTLRGLRKCPHPSWSHLHMGLRPMTSWVPCLNLGQLWGAIPGPKNSLGLAVVSIATTLWVHFAFLILDKFVSWGLSPRNIPYALSTSASTSRKVSLREYLCLSSHKPEHSPGVE